MLRTVVTSFLGTRAQHLRPGRRFLNSIALVIAILAGSANSAEAATPGSWTGWTLNKASGCWTAAQVPYLNSAGQVTAQVELYCSSDVWLTVSGRVRSDRTLLDKTVATTGCAASSTCPDLVRGGVYLFFRATCQRTPTTPRVTHGYHSDITIYPGTNEFAGTTSTSPSVVLSPYCSN